jgi:hypothetical protein
VFGLEFQQSQKFENSKRIWGAPIIRGKTSKKFENLSVGPVKVDLLNHIFMLFDAILTAVSEKIAFNLTKIIQGTCLGLLKVVFGKATYGPFDVFIRVFNSVQLS